MITVLLADDNEIVRRTLSDLLERAGDIQIVVTASNGQEALEQAVIYRPNVVVMDVSMPVMNGIEATRNISVQCPETKVLMVSMYDSAYDIQRSLQGGALGYVLKDDAGGELITAVRSISDGNRYFSEQIADIAKRFL